ncbi:MAG: carbamoyltransferase HypF [Gammaproteobacteria bacterium]|nr:carbamoyltransferase HypF [Gammaproteobacteria bacterium]
MAYSAARFTITGQVQGVGFRPFIYRLALQLQLSGWVQNAQGVVEIYAEGKTEQLQQFKLAMINDAPSLAQPHLSSELTVAPCHPDGFFIKESVNSGAILLPDIHLPPDSALCRDCLAELQQPKDRRYHYPFINCTQCGPRYTLIYRLPYDRATTSMADFHLCPACDAEYRNPLNRRFHAEPVACPDCGPHLWWQSGAERVVDNDDLVISRAVAALKHGEIVAVKGIGGYHLCCDATQEAAVQRLRQRKQRLSKPLAVIFPEEGEDGCAALRRYLLLPAEVPAPLYDSRRAIVLLSKKESGALAAAVAPGLDEVGAMLPYSPLHYLLMEAFARPMVATSGNMSGEPVLTDEDEATVRLATIADAFIHHNRPIVRPADDAVFRAIGGQLRPLRLGRGFAPLAVKLPRAVKQPTLAVGGQSKNAIALAWGDRLLLSPHIGDLGTLRSEQIFVQVIADLQRLYQVEAKALCCDAHEGYDSSRWAVKQRLPCHKVWHHHAHAAALYGEILPTSGAMAIFTWDGVGLGCDGTLWGGELLCGSPRRWQRFASLRPFRLIGGDSAARQPWRSALSLLWEIEGVDAQLPRHLSDLSLASPLLRQMWQKGLNSPQTSAVGRLFDGCAALLNLNLNSCYEGEAPALLEALATRTLRQQGVALNSDQLWQTFPPLPLPLRWQGELWLSDWQPLVSYLLTDSESVAVKAIRCHTSLAQLMVAQAEVARAHTALTAIGLCGGVMQNNLLVTLAQQRLQRAGFSVHLATLLPTNDAALAFGQIISTLWREDAASES